MLKLHFAYFHTQHSVESTIMITHPDTHAHKDTHPNVVHVHSPTSWSDCIIMEAIF